MQPTPERPYHIQVIYDLRENYSPEHFRHSITECRKVIAQLIAEDNRSEQQVARVHILRYLDLQLSRAIEWADREADLLAIVLRALIDLRAWSEYVSTGKTEAEKFLNEVNIDIREIHEKMDKAVPGGLEQLPHEIKGKRQNFDRANEFEEYFYKLCSKLIHPSALMLLHPEATISLPANKENISVEILFLAWWNVTRFHNINWEA